MPLRISPDKNQPSVAIEIPLEKPLPDYDLHQIVLPTPREIDAVLVSQGRQVAADWPVAGVALFCLSPRSSWLDI